METKQKTEAYVLDKFGQVVGIVDTEIKSGRIRYGFQRTIDGTPVNTRVGRLSRNKKYAKSAKDALLDDDLDDLYILDVLW